MNTDADRVERLFCLDQPPAHPGFHGAVWEAYQAKWKTEYTMFHQKNDSPRIWLLDSLNHIGGVILQFVRMGLLIAGALVLLLMAGIEPGQVIAGFPTRDFWMAETIGLGLYVADQVISIIRNRKRLRMSVLDQRARVHMAAWSQGYFMFHAGVQYTAPPHPGAVAA